MTNKTKHTNTNKNVFASAAKQSVSQITDSEVAISPTKPKTLTPKLRFKEFEGEFKSKEFDEITAITRLAGYEYSQYWVEDENKEIIALRGYNIGKGKLELRDLSYISDRLSMKLKRSRLSIGDIVYPCVGSIGNAVVIEENNKFHIQQNIAKITCDSKTSPYFLVHFLTSDYGMKEVYKFNASGAQPNVLVGSLRKFKLNIPQLPEQQKIASFLTSVDTKIQQLTTKKELLTQYKKGAMQQLFSQQLRFKPVQSEVEGDENSKAFPDWEEKRLGDLIIEYKENSKVNDEFEVLTSSNKGLMLQSDYYGENRLTERNNIGFNIIPENYITYRSRSDNRKFTFNLNNLGITGIISTYYPVFNSILGDPNFIVENLNYYQNYIGKYSVGTSQTVLSYNQLKKIKFSLPSLKEQQKIANYLSALDTKIETVNQQLLKTQTFKKGLLQQLFV
ncbi:restriction endonuclease subunit S [Lutibacter sp. TH_r2]|uniref:restriction endonuclease subunit S n=1 Tax=Lutibacter sp. TH_r2 TaxID=3082083 RepID=UPI00295548E7|nr:restriction endonuclease subunit S [Lutibacter sp. TH_r2]MDV7187419.1 restriction endonuclease subunit S [Lutibacter sp. TH_r2]